MLKYVVQRLEELEFLVERERRIDMQHATYIPDVIAKKGDEIVVPDVQGVGLHTALSQPDKAKMTPDLLSAISPTRATCVSGITVSYRGCWAKESVNTLCSLGFTRNDFHTRNFAGVHQQMSTMTNGRRRVETTLRSVD